MLRNANAIYTQLHYLLGFVHDSNNLNGRANQFVVLSVFSRMNNNENLGPQKLSAEQQARISQKFRAAKALRDRKRPREIINSSDQFPQK